MEIEEQNSTSFKDYLLIARRRKYFIAIPMLIFLALSVFVALVLPPIYRSQATILIEQQHIPVDLVKSTVVSFADERIRKIQQKIMRIDNINKIIDKFNLYQEDRAQLSAAELAENFVENVNLDLVSADVISHGRKSKATLAFNLSFDHRMPQVSQKVANELVTLFLSENARSRTERAKETTIFLQEESQKYRKEIQNIENEIAEFKEKYSESLPELLPVTLSTIGRIENQLQQLSMQEKLLAERKTSLRTQLSITNPSSNSSNSQESVPNSLPELKAEYNRLINKYSESHPDVKALKRKINNYKTEDIGTDDAASGISNPIYLQLRDEIRITTAQVTNIEQLKIKLTEELNQLQKNVSQTHQVERGYNDLMRDLEGKKLKYQELKAKLMDAKLAQSLEEEQKAEKFSILEPPRVPTKPEKPNRIKIILIGFVLSVVGGIGVGYIKEILDGSIRGQKSLVSITGEEPLVVIPYLINDEDLERTRRNKIYFAMLGVFLICFMAGAVHFLYMGLDVLFYKVLHNVQSFILH